VKSDAVIGACPRCGFLVAVRDGKQSSDCACDVRSAHPDEKCKFRLAMTCAVGIECDHGYDVCPTCDPCTCEKERT